MRQKSRRPGDHSSYLRAAEYAAFIQDDFKVTPNLTINYGVRYQLYIPPYETRDHISGMSVPYYPATLVKAGCPSAKTRRTARASTRRCGHSISQ